MTDLIHQKTDQALRVLKEMDIDCWLTFVRETQMASDPAMPFIAGLGVVGISAFILTSSGEKIAILASFDTDAFVAQGVYSQVIPYTLSIKEPLFKVLKRLNPRRIALNYSIDDCASDGLSLGMYRMMEGFLKEMNWEGSIISAEPVISAIRGLKTSKELELIRIASENTLCLFKQFEETLSCGWTTDKVVEYFQTEVDKKGWDFSWDRGHNPSLTSGPSNRPGHGTAVGVKILPGHVLRIDFGIRCCGYSSDLQRSWYLLEEGEKAAPAEVLRTFEVVLQGIRAAKNFLRPGVAGWEVDAVARQIVLDNGFEEFDHSLGHQIGSLAHDGGGGLSPRWERYGKKPYDIVRENQVYTLEFGLPTPRGWVSLEEMVRVTADGCEYIVHPQEELRLQVLKD